VSNIGNTIEPDYKTVDTFLQSLTNGITKGSGKLVALNNTYSFMNQANRDFVKKKRYQYVNGLINGKPATIVVDITTGRSTTSENFKKLSNEGTVSKNEMVGYKKVKSEDGVPLTIQKKVGKSLDEFSVFKMVNLYGSSRIVTEYPRVMSPSAFDNNTFKVEEELTDNAIIAIFAGEVVPTTSVIADEQSLASEMLEEATEVTTIVEPVIEEEEVTPEQPLRTIKVNQFNITIQPDGKMFFDNGKEVTDQTIKNKVNIRKELQDGNLRISVYNNNKYFVLSNNKILGSGKTNLGKDTVTDPKIKQEILDKAVLYKPKC
jgi:hypothetical protein